jgi:hypothetical protein
VKQCGARKYAVVGIHPAQDVRLAFGAVVGVHVAAEARAVDLLVGHAGEVLRARQTRDVGGRDSGAAGFQPGHPVRAVGDDAGQMRGHCGGGWCFGHPGISLLPGEGQHVRQADTRVPVKCHAPLSP